MAPRRPILAFAALAMAPYCRADSCSDKQAAFEQTKNQHKAAASALYKCDTLDQEQKKAAGCTDGSLDKALNDAMTKELDAKGEYLVCAEAAEKKRAEEIAQQSPTPEAIVASVKDGEKIVAPLKTQDNLPAGSPDPNPAGTGSGQPDGADQRKSDPGAAIKTDLQTAAGDGLFRIYSNPGAPAPDPATYAFIRDRADSYSQSSGAKPSALGGFSRFALAAGDPARAEKLASKGIELHPDSDLFSVRSGARLSLGNAAGAKEDAKRALALDPSNKLAQTVSQFAAKLELDPSAKPPDASKLIRDFGASSAGSLAGGRSNAAGGGAALGGDGSGAVLGGGRGGPAGFGTMTPSGKLAAEAQGLAKIGDIKGALRQATMAIDSDKSNPDAYAARAGVWNKMQRYLNATQDADQALSLAPGHQQALDARAFAFNMTGRPKEAQSDALKVLESYPRDATAYLNLAISDEALGDLPGANDNYRKASDLDPSYKPFYDDFLSKHREFGSPSSSAGVLGSKKTLFGGAAALALAGVGFVLFKKRRSAAPEAEAELPPPSELPQGAETIRAPEAPQREALPTLAHNGGATAHAAAGVTTPAPPAAGPNGGMLIARVYEVRKELGRGGMGVVYEAFDTSLGRKVAIKEMRPEIAQSARDKERFLSEARTVAKFQHPNIVGIFSILEDQGRTFLVFEHVEGGSLDKYLDQHGKLGRDVVVPLINSIGAALDYSHSRKVIHRDLKPANIMITDEGVVKVMDFGIAHEAKLTVSRLTNAEVYGTMAYMPPEQELGKASKESDVFAFAVLSYETLVGRLPYPGPNYLAQKKDKLFMRPSQADPALPAALDAVFEKALEPDPADRFHSAGEFARAFQAAL